MQLSKEQIDVLQKVESNNLPLDLDSYNSNQILMDLERKGLVDYEPEYDESIQLTGLKRIYLTQTGKNELSIHINNEKSAFKTTFTYPLITNTISGVIGIIIGSAITYFFMK
ncbi:hypothetical protein [Liquorilactobacillus nagelii]|uniref:hypothetical protein n=1 Tax=Liquorilactobacillus nagelii TaxID=82688 RepID=UPI002430A54A|nr:hypothetical protein [Liquorilactobacillus nagelii]MCI1699435.1 hypothetical protein [Liquorilactobacillus nagelii]